MGHRGKQALLDVLLCHVCANSPVLSAHAKVPFLMQVFLAEFFFRQEGGGSKILSEFFVKNQFKINIPKGTIWGGKSFFSLKHQAPNQVVIVILTDCQQKVPNSSKGGSLNIAVSR